jgi:hypothetical protein
MAKRKSFDEKSKGMHKTRKLIIDTVFGREDNNKKSFGYEKETEQKREVGETWVDSEGKEWRQEKGFKTVVTEMDDVRDFLHKLSHCSNEGCKTVPYSWADKKLISKTGMCATCLAKFEMNLRADGTFPFYEDYKITNNKLAYVRDYKDKMEEALRGVKQQMEIVTEDGKVEKWEWQVDIEKVKTDLKKDIDGAFEAIELLIERKRLLEEKLVELNHPELIKK